MSFAPVGTEQLLLTLRNALGMAQLEAENRDLRERSGATDDLLGDSRVMAELREVDHVAYVRFASVYRSFKDLDDFMVQLKELLAEHAHGNDAASADLAAARFGDSVSGP